MRKPSIWPTIGFILGLICLTYQETTNYDKIWNGPSNQIRSNILKYFNFRHNLPLYSKTSYGMMAPKNLHSRSVRRLGSEFLGKRSAKPIHLGKDCTTEAGGCIPEDNIIRPLLPAPWKASKNTPPPNLTTFENGPPYLEDVALPISKRIGNEFLGKRAYIPSIIKVPAVFSKNNANNRISTGGEPLNSYPVLFASGNKDGFVDMMMKKFMQFDNPNKRQMGSEFLGKRGVGSEFLGKRTAPRNDAKSLLFRERLLNSDSQNAPLYAISSNNYGHIEKAEESLPTEYNQAIGI